MSGYITLQWGGGVPEPAPVSAAVPDAAWSAVRGKQVTISSAQGDVEGELGGSHALMVPGAPAVV